jgi:hypothetical protein
MEVSSFTPRPLYPQGKSPSTHWIGGWVGRRAFFDAVVKRKNSSPCRESNPGTPIVQPVAPVKESRSHYFSPDGNNIPKLSTILSCLQISKNAGS